MPSLIVLYTKNMNVKKMRRHIKMSENQTKTSVDLLKEFPCGGGSLTGEEVNHILNSLPLEISFIDKDDEVKYFNERAKTTDMIFVRTRDDIGKTVYEAHPPKSHDMVKQLVKDLKTKKRTSESMWYKTKDQFIFITFKGVFNEKGEYLGIIELVQDIQPFFELPSDQKFGLSEIE